MKTEYYIAFYWLCAGMANYRVARTDGWALVEFPVALIFGGIAVPVRILSKLAA